MKPAKISGIIVLLMLSVATQNVFAQGIYSTPSKKIVAYNMNAPTPAYYRDHLAEIEKQPINGLFIRLPIESGRGQIFKTDQWTAISQKEKDQQLRIMKALPPSKKITDNFLMIFGASTMDWFNDKDWEIALNHLRYCVSLAKAANFKGICWDPESYSGHNPWKIDRQPNYKLHSFSEYYNMVRKRGASFIKTIQETYPGVIIFSVRQLSDFQDGSPYSQHMLQLKDEDKQRSILENSFWALHTAFTNGILDAIDPAIRFIDGNEDSYYYTSALDFYKSVAVVKHDAHVLVAPENRPVYSRQVEVGQSVSSDFTGAFWGILSDKDKSFPARLAYQAYVLSPKQRAQWYEHNLYYALTTAYEYIWLYDETLNWWENKNIPLGYKEAMESALEKHKKGKPLGFSVETMLIKAQEKARKKYEAKQ